MNETNEQITYNKNDLVETPQHIETTITKIQVKKGGEIFVNKEGEVKTDKPNEDFVCLTLTNEEKNFSKEYHIKKYDNRNVPDNSNLGKFIKRYGGIELGVKITLIKNSKGYYDLVL